MVVSSKFVDKLFPMFNYLLKIRDVIKARQGMAKGWGEGCLITCLKLGMLLRDVTI